MKKPLIAITAQFDKEKGVCRYAPGNMESVLEHGGIPFMLPITDNKSDIEQIVNSFDGFIFSGGPDFHPSLYGEDIMEQCGEICSERDSIEPELLKAVLKTNKPVLGICRGSQLINVILGGTLYQDIPTQYATEINHRRIDLASEYVHSVNIVEGTPLMDIIGTNTIKVNSTHHQAVKDLAPSLKVAAISEDGIIEATYFPGDRFLMAVQWHPERLFTFDEYSRKIFVSFIDAVKERLN